MSHEAFFVALNKSSSGWESIYTCPNDGSVSRSMIRDIIAVHVATSGSAAAVISLRINPANSASNTVILPELSVTAQNSYMYATLLTLTPGDSLEVYVDTSSPVHFTLPTVVEFK